jgi:hypothetical protein
MTMTKMKFDYLTGRIDVRFRHERHDWLCMRIRASTDRITTTCLDNDYYPLATTTSPSRRVTVSVRLSSVYCPFTDLIHWLEAVAIGVSSCSFRWDAEGAEGSMQWGFIRCEDTGRFTLDWSRDDTELSISLSRDQMVRAIYQAFRRFVESSEYDPLRYESYRLGDRIPLRSPYTEEEVIGQVLPMNARSADRHLQRILWGYVTNKRDRMLRKQFIATLSSNSVDPDTWGEVVDDGLYYLAPEWNHWPTEKRRKNLVWLLDGRQTGPWGSPLRQLRSEIVERYLAWPAANDEVHRDAA